MGEEEPLPAWLESNRDVIGAWMLETFVWIQSEAFAESLASDPDFVSTTEVRPDGSLTQLWGRRKDRQTGSRSHRKADDN